MQHYKKFVLTVFSIVLPFTIKAQQWHGSAYSESMCGAMSCETGFNSVGYNPAGAATSPLGVGLGYYDKYLMKELSQKSAKLAVPIGNGVATGGFCHYGFNLFSQIRAQLGYSMKLGKEFMAGIHLNYHNIHIDDSPQNSHALTGDIGIIFIPTNSWSFGTTISNVTNEQYNDFDSIIPMKIQFGARYYIYGGHHLNIDLEKNSLDSEIIVRLSANMQLYKSLSIIVGASSGPITMGGGLEYRIKGLKIQFATQRNQYLGWIPSVSLAWTKTSQAKLMDN